MKLRILSFLLAIVTMAGSAIADDTSDKVQTILDQAAKTKSYHQNTLLTMDMMGSKMEMSGEMWASGKKMRVEMTMQPMNTKQIVVSDGDMTYTYMPMMKMVQKMDMQRIRAALGEDFNKNMMGAGGDPDPFQGVDKASLKYLGTEAFNGEDLDMLEGKIEKPSENMPQMTSAMPETVKYWVSNKDSMPRKVVFFGKEGQEMMSQQFSNVEVNPDLDASLFDFKAPEGAQEVDMTDGVINMYQEMKSPSPASSPSLPVTTPAKEP